MLSEVLRTLGHCHKRKLLPSLFMLTYLDPVHLPGQHCDHLLSKGPTLETNQQELNLSWTGHVGASLPIGHACLYMKKPHEPVRFYILRASLSSHVWE